MNLGARTAMWSGGDRNLFVYPNTVLSFSATPQSILSEDKFVEGVIWKATASNGYVITSGGVDISDGKTITVIPSNKYYVPAIPFAVKPNTKYSFRCYSSLKPISFIGTLYKSSGTGFVFDRSRDGSSTDVGGVYENKISFTTTDFDKYFLMYLYGNYLTPNTFYDFEFYEVKV